MHIRRCHIHYLLLLLGVVLLFKGAYIHVKAQVAQWFLDYAWQQTLEYHQPRKPWPWADVYPVARLVLESDKHKHDYIVLNSHAGEAMAFGPGAEVIHDAETDSESWIIGGHRDTHFHFLKNVAAGDVIFLYTTDGKKLAYRIDTTLVADSRTQQLQLPQQNSSLILVTCYPFDSLEVGGPLRYVVQASLLDGPLLNRSLDDVAITRETGFQL